MRKNSLMSARANGLYYWSNLSKCWYKVVRQDVELAEGKVRRVQFCAASSRRSCLNDLLFGRRCDPYDMR
jgi:hypothetical protein